MELSGVYMNPLEQDSNFIIEILIKNPKLVLIFIIEILIPITNLILKISIPIIKII